MKLNVYCIFDTISDSTVVIGTASTDGAFIRQNAPYLSKINENYLNDFIVYNIGEFVESTCELIPSPKKVVRWDSYNKPEITPPSV